MIFPRLHLEAILLFFFVLFVHSVELEDSVNNNGIFSFVFGSPTRPSTNRPKLTNLIERIDGVKRDSDSGIIRAERIHARSASAPEGEMTRLRMKTTNRS
jgi:hypothetical protein